MKICDRARNRDGTLKKADYTIELGLETFDLSKDEYDSLRDFILNPKNWIHASQVQNAVATDRPKRRGRPPKNPVGLSSNSARE